MTKNEIVIALCALDWDEVIYHYGGMTVYKMYDALILKGYKPAEASRLANSILKQSHSGS